MKGTRDRMEVEKEGGKVWSSRVSKRPEWSRKT